MVPHSLAPAGGGRGHIPRSIEQDRDPRGFPNRQWTIRHEADGTADGHRIPAILWSSTANTQRLGKAQPVGDLKLGRSGLDKAPQRGMR